MFVLTLRRGFAGLPWGIAITQGIALAISAAEGGGSFFFTAPALIERIGSPLGAAALQTLLCAMLGFLWGALSVIWEMETWGLLRQSVFFFVSGLSGTLLVECLCGWVDLDWSSLMRFLGIFSAVFAAVWIVLYNWYRRRIRHMNECLRRPDKK